MPLDIVYLIVDCLAPRDFVAFSSVARCYRRLLNDRTIWKRLYQGSTLPLPHGPHEWQSASDLRGVLVRSDKVQVNWPHTSGRPEIICSRYLPLDHARGFSVLLDRWILAGIGSTIVCYDSRSSDMEGSAKTLFDAGAGRHIHCVLSAGTTRPDGCILAFAVIFIQQEFTIAKIIMTAGKPSGIQPVFESQMIGPVGFYSLAKVTLRHRLLIVTIGDYAWDWESTQRLVVMDVDTLRRYHIPTPVPLERIKLTLAGLTVDDCISLVNIFLEPSGRVASKKVDLVRLPMASSLWLDSTNGRGRAICTIAPKSEFVALAFDHGQDSISISCSDMMTMTMPTPGDPPTLVAFDAFGGTAFFESVSSTRGRGVEILEFASDARESEKSAAEPWVVQLGWT
ncbi:hypothetical protein PAXINDRAFT_180741 [Paxillus involutus ATCC 200175]|uniref:F-box domain-containing protein n=1 Tax=Paxillus involutus ATCC 200175 TaxID=664439 RepID=A0A0C9SYM1_PAXIN|nr:hypothetical protein PAXINDRAFT_180741 [Paxillus involutus ATCC 200175]